MIVFSDEFEFRAYEAITVANTSIGFTTATYVPTSGDLKSHHARVAVMRLETGPIRYRMDGTDPTTTTGVLMNPLDTLVVRGEFNIRNFRAIRTTATSGSLTVHYGF